MNLAIPPFSWHYFSWERLNALILKEFIQMLRDRVTFAMLVIIPLMQLILFGYAINTNPKHLPTAYISADHSIFTRELIKKLENTGYFNFITPTQTAITEKQADQLMRRSQLIFILTIPPNFSQELVRGQKPSILLTSDASDPVAGASAIASANALMPQLFNAALPPKATVSNTPPANLITHAKYNPELITAYNITPGLMGIVLTMTMIIVASIGITREYERGTMENLLATPVRPIEVLLGKVLPYILMGYLQMMIILIISRLLFHIPIQGSLLLLFFSALPFIIANLSIGVMFSTLAKNQLQAVQMAFFFFLPSILLSGFMFPFYGMPLWAQWVGKILPLTYFLRIVRGIVLKGNGWIDTWPNIWPIILFMSIALWIGAKRYRQTLD